MHLEDGGKIFIQKYSADGYDSGSQTEDEQEPPLKKRKKITSPLSVVICTPLMARVHWYIPQAGEIAFIDFMSSLNCYNLSMFTISTSYSGGGLPLGVMITSNEKANMLQNSFACLFILLPENTFFGLGPSNGPKVFMSDDCSLQSQAISDLINY